VSRAHEIELHGTMTRKTRIATIAFGFLFCSVSSAQFYYFGRNKVQYTDFEWQVMKTEHFEIYYYPEMFELAQRGAAFAESSYKLLEQKFNHNINHRIPLIFYSSHLHFQQTNTTPGFIPEGVGGFFEFIKGRVVIPSDGSVERFRHVIQHELVHVFMHSKINRVLTDHRQPLDRSTPLWFTEGLAEFWSTEWDQQAEMVLRDAVVNDYIVPVNDMDRIYGSFLMYKEGQKLLSFVEKKFGDEKILLLLENFWKSQNFGEVMKATIGKNYKEFDEEWLYALKKEYYPTLKDEDLPSVGAKTLVGEGFNAKPVFHKNGDQRELYYIGNQLGYTNVYRINLDDEKPKPTIVIEGEKTEEYEAFHLFQGKLDVSKSGMLAFVTKAGENDAIHLYDTKTEKLLETIRFRSLVMLGSVSWSPDGKQLAFSSIDKSGNSDLFILDLDSRALQRLTNDYYDDREPAWSPDGKTIAFSSDRTSTGKNGTYNLFSYSLETKRIEYLTFGGSSFTAPSWSPTGRYLTFTADIGGVRNIWMMDVASPESRKQIKQMTKFVTATFDPAWTDDDALIFTGFENFSFQLRTYRNASYRFDTTKTSVALSLDSVGTPWTVSGISGPVLVDRYKYSRDYSLDIAQSAISTDPVFGTTGGAIMAMSDLMGNDLYYFLISNTAQSKDEILSSFNIAVSRISVGNRTNAAYGIFRFAGNRYDLTDPNLFYYEQSFGGYYALSYPLSKFKRIETDVSVTNSEKDIYIGNPRRALMISNSISYVWDNSIWGGTGPLDGNRLKLELAYTNDVQYSNVNYYSVIADYRTYLRLGTRSALAFRSNVWYNDGKEARRFFMGGSWDLRGWDRFSIRAKKTWLSSLELRFPFIDQLGIRFPFGGISLGAFRGAIFADAGGAWDDRYIDTKGSIGAGVRLSLGILVLRYDIGKRIENDFTRLQSDIYHQFFFGWDF